ncbi:MAG: GDSL-type esterase/lipase family protein [Phycisphaerae bacterium]|nr:GDSL-type esterase/lipase family protein [Phycisphaerae bacterium]
MALLVAFTAVVLAGMLALSGPQNAAPPERPTPQPAPPPASVTPTPRAANAAARQDEVVRRVQDAKGNVPLVFVGDSITQGWEQSGKRFWDATVDSFAALRGSPLTALNLGVGGDRTEHVLWRLREAPLTPLDPRAVVLMIGTNNIGHDAVNPEETLLGVRTIVELLLAQCPNAKVILFAIFPRGERMNPMRGDLCQINQALATLASDRVHFIDIGSQFVTNDGALRNDLMPDFLHLSPAGYAIWAHELTAPLSAALLQDAALKKP